MHDPSRMRLRERREHLHHGVDGLANRQRTACMERDVQRLPLEVLHHHVGATVGQNVDVEDPHDVLAAQGRGRLALALEARRILVPLAVLAGRQHLDGNVLVDRQMARPHHHAEAAAAELLLDALLVADEAAHLPDVLGTADAHERSEGDAGLRALHDESGMLPSGPMARSAKRRRRKNLDAPETMEDLLDRAGEDRFAKRRPPIPMKEWKIAVGPRIADRAHPVTLERGILLVKVTTSVWANELQMLAPELVARLRVRGYAVDQLRFRVGPLDMPDRPPERRITRKVPPPVVLSAELTATIDQIGDPDLRAVIARAASANLAWQDFVSPVSGAPKSVIAEAAARAARSSEAPRAARVPRDAGTGSAPPDRSGGASGGASPRTRGGDSGRRR
jgi:hypothetical protein